MNALEARKLAEETNVSDFELQRFYKSVKETATGNRGRDRFSMAYSADLISGGTVEYLKRQGYGFKLVTDTRDGNFYEVSW